MNLGMIFSIPGFSRWTFVICTVNTDHFFIFFVAFLSCFFNNYKLVIMGNRYKHKNQLD